VAAELLAKGRSLAGTGPTRLPVRLLVQPMIAPIA
jgi:hypothetical protein